MVENGRVITGDGTVHEQASVVVTGDSILSVTGEPVEAPEARRIDASGKTVLPGLIDAHVHLTIPPDGRDSTALVNYLDDGVAEVLRGFLEHGVTTVRSTGDYWPWIRDVRERVDQGDLSGPRIVTAGPVFTAPGGHPATSVCAGITSNLDTDRIPEFCRSHLTREVGEPQEARKAVERLAQEGVDFIKFVSDTGVVPVAMRHEVMAAIIDQAHREGLKTVGHVYGEDFLVRTARAGLDGFVHSPFRVLLGSDDRGRWLASLLNRHGIAVTTTGALPWLLIPDKPVGPVLDGESSRRNTVEAWAEGVRTLSEAGVSIVVGTDWFLALPGTMEYTAIRPGAVTITEMKMLRWGGMPREAIIQAATANAARALEMEEKVGTLEAGKLADLIVVDGNPLEDLSALEEVEVVVQGGKVVAED